MAKIIFGIIAIVVLVVGIVMIFGGAVFYPAKKYQGNEKFLNHKRMKIKLIGYVVCLVAFLICIILGMIN